MTVPPEVFGPVGALVLAMAVITAMARALLMLWREHLEADKDDRAQRDKAMALASEAVDGTKRMAAAWEQRNQRDAARQRRGDP